MKKLLLMFLVLGVSSSFYAQNYSLHRGTRSSVYALQKHGIFAALVIDITGAVIGGVLTEVISKSNLSNKQILLGTGVTIVTLGCLCLVFDSLQTPSEEAYD